jgi:hypothetical protein
LPLINETLTKLGKADWFIKINIQQAFHRLRMASDQDKELTTFRTRYGIYKYRVVPFSLTNRPAIFQRFLNNVLFEYLDDFYSAYLDNILIFTTSSLKKHQEHVRKVLLRLREASLQADIKKSEFHIKRTKYLGLIITIGGIEVDLEKITTIRH